MAAVDKRVNKKGLSFSVMFFYGIKLQRSRNVGKLENETIRRLKKSFLS